jgi:hypothetical protein
MPYDDGSGSGRLIETKISGMTGKIRFNDGALIDVMYNRLTTMMREVSNLDTYSATSVPVLTGPWTVDKDPVL